MRRLAFSFALVASVTLACEESAYDPCAGKTVGDECKLCAPDDADCVETMIVKTCNAEGTCGTHPADGGAPHHTAAPGARER